MLSLLVGKWRKHFFLWVNGERQFDSCLCNYNNICFYSITHRTISHLFAALVEGCSVRSLYKFPKQHLIHYYIITCDEHQYTYIQGKLVWQLNFKYSVSFLLINFICDALKKNSSKRKESFHFKAY